MKDDPADYTPESDDDLLQLVMRSQPKGRRKIQAQDPSKQVPLPLSTSFSSPSSSSSHPSYYPDTEVAQEEAVEERAPPLKGVEKKLPSASQGMTALSTWSKGVRGTPRDAHLRWTRRQIESRHHFIIVRPTSLSLFLEKRKSTDVEKSYVM